MTALLAMGGVIYLAFAVCGVIADCLPSTPSKPDFQGDDDLA